MFNWTVKQSDHNGDTYTAINARTYMPIDSMSVAKTERKASKIAAYLFPAQLRFTASTDRYFHPRLDRLSVKALPLNILLLALFLLFFRKGQTTLQLTVKSITVALLGIFAIVPLLVLRA